MSTPVENLPALLPTAEICVVGNQFNAPDTTVRESVPADGRRIIDALPTRVTTEGEWIVIENGRVLTRDEWQGVLRSQTQYLCYSRIHGSSMKLIVGGILLVAALATFQFELLPLAGVLFLGSIGAGMALGGASEMITGPPKGLSTSSRSALEDQSSPTYGFTGIKNGTRQGAAIPVVYGRHRVGGQYLQVFISSGSLAGHQTHPVPISLQAFALDNLNERATLQTYVARMLILPGTVYMGFNQPTPFYYASLTGISSLMAVGDSFRVMVNGEERIYYIFFFNDADTASTVQWSGTRTSVASAPFEILKSRSTEGDNDLLNAQIAVSEGEISSISDIEINGQSIENYRSVKVETRLGSNTQSAMALFGDATRSAFPSDAVLTTDWIVYTTDGTNLTSFEVGLILPGGLYAVYDDGGLSPFYVSVELQYKRTIDATWTVWDTVDLRDAKRTAIRRFIRKEGLQAAQWDIRMRRTTPQSDGARTVDEIRRAFVNEVVNDAYTYPNLALLGIQALATDQLTGGIPTITSLVEGVKIRVFSSATSYTRVWSNNPSWIVLDVLTNQRYGAGKRVHKIVTNQGTLSATNGSAVLVGTNTQWSKARPGQKLWIESAGNGLVATIDAVTDDTHLTLTSNWLGVTATGYGFEVHDDNIDLQSFVDWAAFCDQLVDDGKGGTEKRSECDLVMDADNTTAWDTAQKIAGLGFAAVVKVGSYIWVKYQTAEPYRQVFGMSNIVKGSFKERFLPLKEQANYFEVAYKNRDNEYKSEMVTWEDPLIATGEETIRQQTVAIFGCTRSSEAARHAMFYAKSNRYLTRTVEIEVGVDAIACQAGDVVAIQHDLPQWGFSSRAATGSTASTMVLDHAMTIVTGRNYALLHRAADDTLTIRNVTNTPGTYTTLTISGTWPTVPQDGDVVEFGEVGILVKPFRLLAVQRTEDWKARLTMVEYNAALYDTTGVNEVSVVQYSALPDPTGPPDPVTNLTLTQLFDAQHTVWVGFTPPSDFRYGTSVVYRLINEQWMEVGRAREGGLGLVNLAPGTELIVKVVSASKSGALSSINAAPLARLVVQTALPPPNVTGLELAGQANYNQFTGRDAKFRWRDRSHISGLGYEGLGNEALGIGSGGTDPSFRDYRVEIYDATGVNLRRRAFVVDPMYTYSFEANIEDGAALGTGAVRSFMIRVWQRDIFNQISELPAALVVSNPPPSLLSGITAIPTFAGIIVKYAASPDLDIDGYKIWVGTGNLGTDPSDVVNDAEWLAYRGKDTYVNLQYPAGHQLAIRVAAFDSFGEVGLNTSPEIFATPAYLDPAVDLPNNSITETKIKDGSISTPKLAANAVTADKVTSGQLITLAAQIADAVITDAHVINLSAAKITTGTITADRFESRLWGDLSRAIAYVQDILSVGVDASVTWNPGTLAAQSLLDGVFVDVYAESPTGVIALNTVRKWDDGLAWWDDVNAKWDEPVITTQGRWVSPVVELGMERTGRAEFLGIIEKENPATATVTVWATYQSNAGSPLWGTNEPTYNDGQYEQLTFVNSVGGLRDRYVGTIRTSVRRVQIQIYMQTSNASHRIAVIDPNVRFNDTRIAPESMNLPTSTTATAGTNGALPAQTKGYFTLVTPDGTPVKVPYYAT